ncbi:MAG: 2-phospho-L-lactate transferase [Alphaproteobacteria bacterium]
MGGRVVALSGGVGGAKLSDGLYRTLPPDALSVIVNTGDDFWHLGLRICPDLDTVTYTLGGRANPQTGWGREGETWAFLEALTELGGETWFRLGDRDLALHVERTRRLKAGATPTVVAGAFAGAFGIRAAILPMCDETVATRVRTDRGWLDFQDYFVRQRCEPTVVELCYAGIETCHATSAVETALDASDLEAIVICPSNPYLSVDPILAVPGIRARLEKTTAPVIAVSPIIAGQAVKGPAAKMMAELGVVASAASVGRHYGSIIDGFVTEPGDAAEARSALACPVKAMPTLMTTMADRCALAHGVLAFARDLRA